MVTNVILNFLFIRSFGINGAAYGTMISYFVVLVYRQIKTKELIDLSYNRFKMYATCGLLMAAGTVVSLDVPFYYLYSIGAFSLVVILFRREYFELLRSATGLIKKKLKKQ